MPYIGGENIPGRGIGALDSATNTQGDSAGLQAVLAQLRARGVKNIDANAIRDIVNENARPGGDPTANGPNLGPVVLNLRNAGIEDASPMPSRGGGGGNTSALPTPPIPPSQGPTQPILPNGLPGANYVPPAMPPPAAIVTPPGGPSGPGGIPNTPLSGDPVTNPVNPQLSPPPAGAMATPPGGGGSIGSSILAGIPAVAAAQVLRGLFGGGGGGTPLALPAPSGSPTQLALPAPAARPPVPALEGPAPQARIAGPEPQLRIAGPEPQRALPAPPNVVPQAGFGPEYGTGGQSPTSAAIDKAVPADAPVAPRAKSRGNPRMKLRPRL